MKNIYKHIVYFLLINIVTPTISQNLQQIQRIKDQFEKSKNQQTDLQIQNQDEINIDPQTGLPASSKVDVFASDTEIIIDELQYFGYNYFTMYDDVKFWENLPVQANYILGAGDELVVSMWGETQLRQNYIISRDGKIFDSKVGLLNLASKTIEEGRKYLNDQFGRVYSTLTGDQPSTYMDISLGQLRAINVNFVGEVANPGLFPVHPFSTVFTGLIQVGGVNNTGSLRNIQIKREGEIYATLDLYNYLLEGIIPENIQLRDQDVVFVPVRISTVIVDSAVARPGIYEAKPNETVRQMINYAGGLKETASHLIGLKRILTNDIDQTGKINKKQNYYIDYDNSQGTIVENGDRIEVRSVFETRQEVEIIGQVKNPGIYYYWQGMTIKDLIDLGGGFNDSTFLKSVYFASGEIMRRNPDSRYETIIKVDLKNIINGNFSNDILLENLDRFVVHANLNYFEKENIKILGEIEIPGSYPQLQDSEPLQSFIDRAGGFTTKAFPEGIEIFRDTIRVAWENTNIPLSPGDSVIVKERPGVIFIMGEIYNSGFIEFQKGKSLKYYVDSAGGVTLDGDKNDILVIYANGVVKPKKFMSTPKVRDGSTIIINRKEPEDPFDATEFANTTLSLLSSLVTIIVLSQQINQ